MLADVPVPAHSHGQAREVVRAVLDDPRYDVPPPTLLERVERWVVDRLADLFGSLLGGGRDAVVGWVILAIAAAALVWLARRAGGTVRRDARVGVATMVELERTPDEWRALADDLEDRGEWKEALRCRYRSLVGDLVRLERIPELPGRTTGEHRDDVRRHDPAAAPAFAAAARLFEAAWYGDRPTGPAESERFRELEAEVLGTVRS